MKQVWALAAAIAALITTGACRDNSPGEFAEVNVADDPPTHVSAAGTGAQEKERPPEKGMVPGGGVAWCGRGQPALRTRTCGRLFACG